MGWRTIHKVEFENGEGVPVKVNTETGRFKAEVGSLIFEGRSKGEIVGKIERWGKERHALDWKPVMEFNAPYWDRSGGPELTCTRLFHAERADGALMQTELDDSGKPDTRFVHEIRGRDGVTIPWDARLWAAAESVGDRLHAMAKALHHAFGNEKRALAFLKRVAEDGADRALFSLLARKEARP